MWASRVMGPEPPRGTGQVDIHVRKLYIAKMIILALCWLAFARINSGVKTSHLISMALTFLYSPPSATKNIKTKKSQPVSANIFLTYGDR